MQNTDILTYASRLEFDKICAAASEYAVCDEARERVRATRPETELWMANQRLELTDGLFVLLTRHSNPAITPVTGIPAIALRAGKGGRLSMAEMLEVGVMLRNARALASWNGGGEMAGEVGRLFFALYEDQILERDISAAILSDSEMSDNASAELRDIRRRIIRAESSVREKLDSIIRSPQTQKYLQDALVTMRGGRFVVPVKQEHRGEIKGLMHDVSSSGSTCFIEPAGVVEANNKIVQLRGEELREIDRILTAFSERVAAIAEPLCASYEALIELDAALAMAKYASSINASRPVLNDEGIVRLKLARHPLIPKETVVPIDVTLGGDYTVMVITGPNTGGKTVTLKTVGLLTLMGMAGMLIPAAEGSAVCVFRQVLADIGDEQSIEQNLSTFSGHIKNTAAILKTADEHSLVLLDELGAGTDPSEGAALATAILERLRRRGSRVVATTHYGELKLYALENDGVQNASCEFDVATLRPTYRLMVGLPGRSNALLIGERLGLDNALIEDARQYMSAEDRRFEDVLDEIEQIKSQMGRDLDDVARQRREAAELLEAAQAEQESMLSESRRALDAARNKANQMSADVVAGAHKLLDELRRLDKEKAGNPEAVRRRARAIVSMEASRLQDIGGAPDANPLEHLELLDSVKPGDSVFILALNRTGEALDGADERGNLEVKAGSVKMRVNIADLRRPQKTPDKKKKPMSVIKVSGDERRPVRTEINLHGQTVDEAILEADRFIDDALLAHIHTVTIVHGKGTGALRRGIHSFLKGHRQVKQFRLGHYGEGEDGVTIVELK